MAAALRHRTGTMRTSHPEEAAAQQTEGGSRGRSSWFRRGAEGYSVFACARIRPDSTDRATLRSATAARYDHAMKKEFKAAAEARVARTPSAGRVSATGQPGSPTGVRNEEDALVPNATTIEAMRESRRRKGLPRYASVQALFDGLHAD